ncbi:MAG: hypothetical protein JNG89_15455 [Planctomycetaceae bacterium]|nr:hypothetical protein [Planctomycetaceae bacterium]
MTGLAFAQPGPPPNGGPGGPGRPGGPGGPTAAATNGSTLLITRMLQFDKNADEQLTLEEVTDARLHRLFRRADADHDGTVTKAELTALAAAITAEFPNAGQRGGPGGPGGPRGGGPGGPPPGGPGGFGGPPPGGPLPRRPQ